MPHRYIGGLLETERRGLKKAGQIKDENVYSKENLHTNPVFEQKKIVIR